MSDFGVHVKGPAGDRALAGEGGTEGGRGLVVLLGADTAPPASDDPVVRWLDHAPRSAPAARADERLIAPAGDGLWSRRPVPAADALFGLPPALEPRTALLVGDRDGLRASLLEDAAERGLELPAADRLTVGALERADCVVLLDGEPGTISALAPAVLAARRIVISPRVEIAFGLQAPLDHLQFDAPERALDLVQSVLSQPTAFERMRIWGSLAAERHRASRVYAQLAIDVAAEEGAGPHR